MKTCFFLAFCLDSHLPHPLPLRRPLIPFIFLQPPQVVRAVVASAVSLVFTVIVTFLAFLEMSDMAAGTDKYTIPVKSSFVVPFLRFLSLEVYSSLLLWPSRPHYVTVVWEFSSAKTPFGQPHGFLMYICVYVLAPLSSLLAVVSPSDCDVSMRTYCSILCRRVRPSCTRGFHISQFVCYRSACTL